MTKLFGVFFLFANFKWEIMGKDGEERGRMGKRPLRLLYLCKC